MQITCPQCSKSLEAPFPLPSLAKCPFCGGVFTPVSSAGPPPVPQLVPSPYAPPASYGPAVGATGNLTGSDARRAAEVVQGPAIALLVTGILNLSLAVIDLIARIYMLSNFAPGQAPPNLPPFLQEVFNNRSAIAFGIATDAVGIILAILIMVGSMKMRRLESYGLSMTASIVSMLPCITACCCLGIPFGIWSLIVLNRPEVRSCFH
jgi:hypothetical protein